MSLSTYCEEHSSLYKLLESLHEYILEEYERLWNEGNGKVIPTIEEIVKGVYTNVYDEVSEALVEKIQKEKEEMKLFRPAKEVYSHFFDQHFMSDPLTDKTFFNDICREVEKFFTLYQIIYSRQSGEITNFPVLEVW